MINISRVTEFSEFLKLKEDWNALLESDSSEDMVFLTHEWFDCWWRCFANNSSLFLLVAKEQDKLLGIAPLMVRRMVVKGLPLRLLSFIDNGNSGHNNFIVGEDKRREVLEAFIDCLRKEASAWDMLELKRIPPESKNYKIIQAILRSKGVCFVEKEGTKAPYLKIESDWDTFYNRLSRKTKKTLRNIQNRFIGKGAYLVKKISDFESYEQKKAHLYDINNNSWSANLRSSLNKPANRLFFDKISRVAANKGWLSLWILYLNDIPIAFEYHLRYKNRIHGLRSSYKKDFGYLSLGSFLDFNIIKDIFADGDMYEYDMGGNADFYKLRWTKDFRRHTTLYIFNSKPYSKFVYIYEHLLISFFRMIFRSMDVPQIKIN